MHNNKILVGNSGDKVFLQGNKVIKEAGHYPEKFKQQMDFLMSCDHPNFIDVKPLSETSYEMKRFPTWYDKILTQPLLTSFNQLESLISIVGKFDSVGSNVKTESYLEKLQLRTGIPMKVSLMQHHHGGLFMVI